LTVADEPIVTSHPSTSTEAISVIGFKHELSLALSRMSPPRPIRTISRQGGRRLSPAGG
jgi:hypothetical protein